MQTRRRFIRTSALTGVASWLTPGLAGLKAAPAQERDAVTFFLVGDTHYRATWENREQLDAVSADYNARLVGWLNKLPGTNFPQELAGGVVPPPLGVIHAGDLVDSGDKGPAKYKAAEAEMSAFVA